MVLVRTAQTSTPRRAEMEVAGLPSPRNSPSEYLRDFTVRWVVNSGYELDLSGNAWLPAMLPMLMASGARRGVFLDPQNPKAIEGSHRVQEQFASWYPTKMSITTIDSARRKNSYGIKRGVGCFFSGGVDSFYSAMTRREEITHLVLILGLDIPLDDKLLCEATVSEARRAAFAMNKELVVIRTTIRRHSGAYAKWGPMYHGAALATVGLLLAKHIKHMIIPSSSPLENLHPWGTHPDLDYFWSTDYLHFEHHGEYKSRNEKIEQISRHQEALDGLRVCWENLSEGLNCGMCEKCLRTILPLYAYGTLERCKTMPKKLDPDFIREFDFSRHPEYAKYNLELIRERRGAEDPIYLALESSLARIS